MKIKTCMKRAVLLLLGIVLTATAAWADDTNPKVTIASGPTYGSSAESTNLTLRIWFWNYDGGNAHFTGDTYLTIDGTQTVKLNGIWGTFVTSNEDHVKGKSGSGNYGSQGTITLSGTTVGTAQFKNLQKKQGGGSANNDKWNTIDLVLSFNEKFSFYGHTIGVQGTWQDLCDDEKANKAWHPTVTLAGFPRAKSVKLSRSATQLNPVTVSWSSETYNSSAKTTGQWYIYRNGTYIGKTDYGTKTYTDNAVPATIGQATYNYTVSYCPPSTTISSTRPAGLYSSSSSFSVGIYSLTLSDGISVTGGEAVTTSGGANCYLAGVQLTLGFNTGVLADDQSFDHYIVNGSALSGNTFTMPSTNSTVQASLTDLWGTLSGADGSEAHPYLISSKAGLDLLSSKVNGGKNYNGKYFKLTTDLTYMGTNNFTPIGSYLDDTGFGGTFDGGGYTISGISVITNKGSMGLFGYVFYGTVKNLVLANSSFTNTATTTTYGQGGLAGDYFKGTMANCFVTGVMVNTSSNRHGIIVGMPYAGTTLTDNYYYNCTVAGKTTGVGVCGADVTDNNGAVSVHTLTFNMGTSTTTAASRTYNGTDYYAKGTRIALSGSDVADGLVFNNYTVNGSAISGSSFTMPRQNTTVSINVTDHWGVLAGANGSSTNPYIITTTAGLDMLASKVNGDGGSTDETKYEGKYFELGADLRYDGTTNNYTPIGTEYVIVKK